MHIASLSDAIIIATVAHAEQLDKAGQPYILHPLRVMAAMPDELHRIVAVLHDVVEDSPWTVERIRDRFGAEVADAVEALTKSPADNSYGEYLDRVLTNPVAIKVKLADLKDNMDLGRFQGIPVPESVMDLRVRRYAEAERYLHRHLNQQYEG